MGAMEWTPVRAWASAGILEDGGCRVVLSAGILISREARRGAARERDERRGQSHDRAGQCPAIYHSARAVLLGRREIAMELAPQGGGEKEEKRNTYQCSSTETGFGNYLCVHGHLCIFQRPLQ